MADPLNNLDPTNLANVVAKLVQDVEELKQKKINVDKLADITPDLGDMRAGRFLALSSGREPTDADATGAGISSEGEPFNNDLWTVWSVYLGILQAGFSKTLGKLLFCAGKGIIDLSGINLEGLLYGIRQMAENPTDATCIRYGRLEMFLPDGSYIPGFGLTFTDAAAAPVNVLLNGDFASGDLTNWTQSAAGFSVIDNGDGTFSLEFNDNLGASETLVSDRVACAAGNKFALSLWTKDIFVHTIESYANIADTDIRSNHATTNYGSAGVNYAGSYSSGTCRILLKQNLPTIPMNAVVNSARLHFPVFGSTLSSTIEVYRLLRTFAELEATYNKATSADNWGTAGAENTGTDREAANIGTGTFAGSGSWQFDGYLTLNAAKVKEMCDGTFTNKGFLLKRNPETSDFEIETKAPGYDCDNDLELDWQEESHYDIVVNWYDALVAGTLLQTDSIASENGVTSIAERTKTLTAPAGALSFEVVITGENGREFWVKDIEIIALTILNRLYFGPELIYQDEIGKHRAVDSDGWERDYQTWTYVSATSFTVADASQYQVGDPLRCKQGGAYKYFNIAAIAGTTVTITGGADFSLAVGAITDNYYSHMPRPLGFPGYFLLTFPTWTTTGTAFTNQPVAVGSFMFSMQGKKVILTGAATTHATSGGTGMFIMTFAAGQLPNAGCYAAGASNNMTDHYDGLGYVDAGNHVFYIGKYDGTTLGANSKFITVGFTYLVA
jgi:uncharacterized Zn-binding protein involved in type VI secretion